MGARSLGDPHPNDILLVGSGSLFHQSKRVLSLQGHRLIRILRLEDISTKKENYTVSPSRARRLKLMKRIALVLGSQYLSTPPPAVDSPESRRPI